MIMYPSEPNKVHACNLTMISVIETPEAWELRTEVTLVGAGTVSNRGERVSYRNVRSRT